MNTTLMWFAGAWLMLGTGCMKPAPVPQARSVKVTKPERVQQKPKFTLDPPPEALTAGCRTGHLEGCERNGRLRAGQKELGQLHGTQMAQMETALKVIHEILNRPDSTPTARISTQPLDTNTWTDPEGTYPAKLEVRLQYSRGLDYLGSTASSELIAALDKVDRMAGVHRARWKKTLSKYPSGLKLPKDLLEERQRVQVSVRLTDRHFDFAVPAHLANDYLRRDLSPWDAVVAHVVKEAGSPYKMVDEHRYPLKSALSISAGSSIQIVELSPTLVRADFVSSISPVDACKGLRGELRYVRRDKTPALRAAFTAAPRSGGSK